MNNSNDSVPVPDTPGATFDNIFGIWIPGVVCVMGIVGNALALLVLSRDRRNITLYSLRALACTDLVLLVCALLQQVIPMWCITNNRTDAFCLYQGYIRVYTWPIICIAQMNSIWLTVVISSERFIAIVYPLRAMNICTMKNIRLTVIVLSISSTLFNIPKFFEFVPLEYYDDAANVTRIIVGVTKLREDPVYRYLYNTALYCLVIYAIPLSILTRLNLTIVHKIKKAKENWESLNRSQKTEMKATILPLMIVLVFFISGTQALLAFTLDAIFVVFALWLQIYTAIVNILVILNSALNFILMYVFGRKFRSMLKDAFGCSKKKTSATNTSIRFV